MLIGGSRGRWQGRSFHIVRYQLKTADVEQHHLLPEVFNAAEVG